VVSLGRSRTALKKDLQSILVQFALDEALLVLVHALLVGTDYAVEILNYGLAHGGFFCRQVCQAHHLLVRRVSKEVEHLLVHLLLRLTGLLGMLVSLSHDIGEGPGPDLHLEFEAGLLLQTGGEAQQS